MKKLFPRLVVALLIVLTVTGSVFAAGQNFSISFLPDSHRGPRGSFKIILPQGDSVTDGLLVSNLMEGQPLSTSVSFTPYESPGMLPLPNSWVQVMESPLLIPAASSSATNFTINVPQDSQPGKYGGLIYFGVYAHPVEVDGQSVGVNFSSAIGKKIVLEVTAS